MAGLLYENCFAANASVKKAKGYLLASNYDSDKYEKTKEKVHILEEEEEV